MNRIKAIIIGLLLGLVSGIIIEFVIKFFNEYVIKNYPDFPWGLTLLILFMIGGVMALFAEANKKRNDGKKQGEENKVGKGTNTVISGLFFFTVFFLCKLLNIDTISIPYFGLEISTPMIFTATLYLYLEELRKEKELKQKIEESPYEGIVRDS